MDELKCSLCGGVIDRSTLRCLSCGMKATKGAVDGTKYILNDTNRPVSRTNEDKYTAIHTVTDRPGGGTSSGQCCTESAGKRGYRMTMVIIALCLIITTVIVIYLSQSFDEGNARFRMREYEPNTGRKHLSGQHLSKEEVHYYGMNENVSTEFFDMIIKECSEVTPEDIGLPIYDSNKFVRVKIWLKNTMSEVITMFDDDFALSYDSGYVFPVSDMGLIEQLPAIYDLDKGQYAEGMLYFAVPENLTDAYLIFTEYFDDEEIGSTYYTTVTFE